MLYNAAINSTEDSGASASAPVCDYSSLCELSADDVDAVLGELDVGDAAATSGSSSFAQADESVLATEALKYIAGYVAFKLRHPEPQLGTISSRVLPDSEPCSSWIQTLTCGGLRQPTHSWFETVQLLESEFRKFHGSGLRKDSGIIRKLTATLSQTISDAPKLAIACFVKTRTFIRLRQINRKSASTKRFVAKKKRKYTK